MQHEIELTLVLRQPASSVSIGDRLLAGTFNASETTEADTWANAGDAESVVAFANSAGLRVVKIDLAARNIRVAGTASVIEKAFGIHANVETLNYKGAIELPTSLKGVVIAVLGLDHTPIARSHGQ